MDSILDYSERTCRQLSHGTGAQEKSRVEVCAFESPTSRSMELTKGKDGRGQSSGTRSSWEWGRKKQGTVQPRGGHRKESPWQKRRAPLVISDRWCRDAKENAEQERRLAIQSSSTVILSNSILVDEIFFCFWILHG